MTDVMRTSLRPFGTSVFSTYTQLANQHGAINLAQGFPDFEPPAELTEAGVTAMRGGRHQYAPSVGLPELRRAIAEHARERYGLDYDPETEVTVTVGATEGMWAAAAALLEPGDEAIVVQPSYDAYAPAIIAAGGVPRFVPTTPFPDFQLDLERLEAAFRPRTRLVFLNTPCNPSGRLLGRAELRALGELAERHDAFLVADETYEHVTFGDRRHLPVAMGEGCRARTITASSVSKTFSATGWRIGWILAPPAITDAVRRVHQYVTFAASTPLQWAVAGMLAAAAGCGYFEAMRAEYEERRAVLLGYLERTGLTVSRPDGAYFLLAGSGEDDEEYCRALPSRAGVAAIPASHFYDDRALGRGLVRFAFCKRVETLRAAGERLVAASHRGSR